MSMFSDTFNPCLNHEIATVISPAAIHEQLSKCSRLRTTTDLLFAALKLLSREVQELEESRGPHASSTIHALDVLGAVQSELNLHFQAAETYRRIVMLDDLHEHRSVHGPAKCGHYTPLKSRCLDRRNLEALFNLGLQLNKSRNYIEAEVALRRLIPLARAKHGSNSFQYRNSIEQLIYALRGQSCREGVKDLLTEYYRSKDDEIKERLQPQKENCCQQLDEDVSDYFYDLIESDSDSDSDSESESESESAPYSEIETPPSTSLEDAFESALSCSKIDATEVKAPAKAT